MVTRLRNNKAKVSFYSFRQSSSTQHLSLPTCNRLEAFTTVLVSMYSYENLGSQLQCIHRAVTKIVSQ